MKLELTSRVRFLSFWERPESVSCSRSLPIRLVCDYLPSTCYITKYRQRCIIMKVFLAPKTIHYAQEMVYGNKKCGFLVFVRWHISTASQRQFFFIFTTTSMSIPTPNPRWSELVKRSGRASAAKNVVNQCLNDKIVVLHESSASASQPVLPTPRPIVWQQRSVSQSDIAKKWLAEARTDRTMNPKFLRKAELQHRVEMLQAKYRKINEALLKTRICASESLARFNDAQAALVEVQHKHNLALTCVTRLNAELIALETCQDELNLIVHELKDVTESVSSSGQDFYSLETLVAPIVTPLDLSLEEE